MSKLLIDNVDVSEKVTISACIHEMHAGSRSDSLIIKFDDSEHQFDKWRIQTGLPVEYKTSGNTSGKMYLYSAAPENGYCILRAYSMPVSGTVTNTKPWERAHFTQIGEEIAKRHGLEFECYGLDDIVYQYRAQENQEDFKFFGQLCILERAALMIFDGRLIAAYEPYLESIEPAATIDTAGCMVECEDYSLLEYGAAKVASGPYNGTFKAPEGNARLWISNKLIKCQSNLEALRFAASELREKNKMLISGSIEGPLMSQYAPGIMVNIKNRQMPSWSGAYFIYKVRHDYGKSKTKIFFRRKLEGY